MKPSRIPKGEYSNRHTKTDDGGLATAPVPMKPAVREPCVECPLRRDAAPGYLGGYSPEMYLRVLHSPASLACHSSPGFHEGDIGRQHHCTGVAGYRANVGWIAGDHAGRTSMAHESTRLIGADPRYFESPEEFYRYHDCQAKE